MFSLVLKAIQSETSEMNHAAFRGVAKLGDAPVIPLLLQDSADQAPEMSHVAQTSVVALDGQDVDVVVAYAFTGSEPHIKRIVVEVLGRRRFPESVPKLLFAVDVSNITIREADIRQRLSTSTS